MLNKNNGKNKSERNSKNAKERLIVTVTKL